jgi:hypothetical protein
MDFYGWFNDKLYVIDWKSSKPRNKKTGKGIYPESRYQVAAYRSVTALTEDTKISNVQGCGVLRLDKVTGMPDWNDTSNTYIGDLEVYDTMVDLYFLRHPLIRSAFNKHIKEVGACT